MRSLGAWQIYCAVIGLAGAAGPATRSQARPDFAQPALRAGEGVDLIERGAESVAFDFEVVPAGSAKTARRSRRTGTGAARCVGGDAPRSMRDLVDSARPDADRDGKRVLGDTEG
jgi:hypothetical protein